MGMLVDHQLRKLCGNGRRKPLVTPYDSDLVRPASIDHRLGNSFLFPKDQQPSGTMFGRNVSLIDVPPQDEILEEVILEDDGWVMLHPGKCALASTKEWFNVPRTLAMVIDGRSSIGRLWMSIHVTAGYFDPGFSGIGTLELVNFSPWSIELRPGIVVCQSRWFSLDSVPDRDYTNQYGQGKPGRYLGDKRATGSRYSDPEASA